ncbi:hypothetical protein N7495_008992 [Penicillium taxi]|uniref:uncharacterized protein n=1 Tax=Penicillium taxi TaxID=168475 RepID=UPI002545A9F2|nr:uncharacterized protein N7495_008992 [Penicillium taxi]KAJ5888951.1 hypothetical protein N7495_008992 [Penicillium taxi]
MVEKGNSSYLSTNQQTTQKNQYLELRKFVALRRRGRISGTGTDDIAIDHDEWVKLGVEDVNPVTQLPNLAGLILRQALKLLFECDKVTVGAIQQLQTLNMSVDDILSGRSVDNLFMAFDDSAAGKDIIRSSQKVTKDTRSLHSFAGTVGDASIKVGVEVFGSRFVAIHIVRCLQK